MVLKGHIDITDNYNFVQEVLCMNNTIIISLDETLSLPDLPNVVVGLNLLPPVEALIAETDGNHSEFEICYANHFNNQSVDELVGTIIVLLMSGKNILFYSPKDELSQFSAAKLIDMFWLRYGIRIGVVGTSECTYDNSCVPLWLGYAYELKCINGRDYLTEYPEGVMIPDKILSELIYEFSPFADTFEEKRNYIYSLVYKFKENPGLRIPIFKCRSEV